MNHKKPWSQVRLLGTPGTAKGGASDSKHDLPVPLNLGSGHKRRGGSCWDSRFPQSTSTQAWLLHRATASIFACTESCGDLTAHSRCCQLVEVKVCPAPTLRQPAFARDQCRHHRAQPEKNTAPPRESSLHPRLSRLSQRVQQGSRPLRTTIQEEWEGGPAHLTGHQRLPFLPH